jgi:hypothetical protein
MDDRPAFKKLPPSRVRMPVRLVENEVLKAAAPMLGWSPPCMMSMWVQLGTGKPTADWKLGLMGSLATHPAGTEESKSTTIQINCRRENKDRKKEEEGEK